MLQVRSPCCTIKGELFILKIVVVEDEPVLRELIVDELACAGHDVVEAGDGVAGLEAIEAANPDVIISDIGMPKMDGYQLRQCLKDDPRYNNTPFLFLSALAFQQALDKGFSVGADDYLTKPVDFDTLLSRVSDCGS